MQDYNFSLLAEQVIDDISATIEEQDMDGVFDIDYSNEVLNIHTSLGQYVINKHSAAKEIWLASPISGPYHFAYQKTTNKWLTSTGIDLLALLEKELSEFMKINLKEIK